MKAPDRQFAVLVFGVALIGSAAWHLAVEPMRGTLDTDRLVLTATKSEIAQGSDGSDPAESQRVIDEIDEHAERFTELWARADDASGLYELIQNHAAHAGVRIEHIEPRRASMPGELTKEFNKLGIQVERHSYSIELLGGFNAVREFVHQFQSDGGLARVDSFRLAAARNAENAETITGSVSVSYYAVAGAFASAEVTEP